MKENQKNPTDFSKLDEGLWTRTYPLRFWGLQLGRRVSLLLISDNRLVIHSTGPFTQEQVEEIQHLGNPAILLDGTSMHDTFSQEARQCFPGATYLVPEGFPRKALGSNTSSLRRLDELTHGEVQSIRLEGLRLLDEYACFHPASRTLILCDLLFNLTEARGYTRWAMKYLLGVKQWPAIDRPMRFAVKDKTAFSASMRKVFEWDFDRIIVAHGSRIEKDGKAQFQAALERAGFGLNA